MRNIAGSRSLSERIGPWSFVGGRKDARFPNDWFGWKLPVEANLYGLDLEILSLSIAGLIHKNI